MKKQIIRFAFYGLSIFLMLIATIGQSLAQDGDKIWTSVASAGTVDETDIGEIAFAGPFATFSNSAPTVSRAIIRYNVTAVDGLFAQPGPLTWPALAVNYRDDGDDARVVVYLREYEFGANPMNPALNTRIVFDSDLYPPSNDYQTRAIGNCGQFNKFEFVPNNQNVRAYYLEVLMIRQNQDNNVQTGNPGLGALALSRYGVCLTQ
ncbi:MAG: hypothetical protein JST85_26030 [Acidobacteria bacterium]|nr:hypothetical protein [Acidobacteriota bacterium]